MIVPPGKNKCYVNITVAFCMSDLPLSALLSQATFQLLGDERPTLHSIFGNKFPYAVILLLAERRMGEQMHMTGQNGP